MTNHTQQLSDTITTHKLQHTAISTKIMRHAVLTYNKLKESGGQLVIDIRPMCWVWTYDNGAGARKYIKKTNKRAAGVQRGDFMSCSLWKHKNCSRSDWVSDQSITEVNRPTGSCALTWSISTPAGNRTGKRLCFKEDRQRGFTQNSLHHHTVPILSLIRLLLFAHSLGFWLSGDSTSSQEWAEESACDCGSIMGEKFKLNV